MRCIYSFVLDGNSKFARQAHVFLKTLLATGVASKDVIAHVTPSVGSEGYELIKAYDISSYFIEPLLDGTYCNKIAQLDFLIDLQPDVAILCDTDLAFLEDPALLALESSIRAKVVDIANPPWERLEQIRLNLGIKKEPRAILTSCDNSLTYSTNCNGGLYIIPGRLLERLGRQWLIEATVLYHNISWLGDWSAHVDQISFAMAMLRLGLDVEQIPISCNFPYHLADTFRSNCSPRIIHYHSQIDALGLLAPVKDPLAWRSASAVNNILRETIHAER